MITCEDLDAFVDLLCDSTALLGLDRAREIGDLLKLIETVPQKFLMQQRAAAVADLHYLEGVPMRQIAIELGFTTQAVKLWLANHGPSHYVTVGYEHDKATHGEQRLVLRAYRTQGEDTKALLRRLQGAGRRIAPATMDLVDTTAPDCLRPGIDAQRLWDELVPK